MITKYQQVNQKDYEQALNFLDSKYLENLLKQGKSKESIVGRYFLSQVAKTIFGIKDFLPLTDTKGVPQETKGFHWSLSHSGDIVFVGLSRTPIGIDGEIVLPRSESLFQTEKTIFFTYYEPNWENYYSLWTAKESLIKYLRSDLSILDQIQFIDWKDSIISLGYNREKYSIRSAKQRINETLFITAICS